MSNRPFAQRKADYYSIVEEARRQGIPHPEVIAAQWAVESDWGDKVTGQHNYFGIKAGDGRPDNNEPGTVAWTHEVVDGKRQRVQQKFRDFDTMADAIRARGEFTNTPGGRYEQAGYHSARNPHEALLALQKAGYATDPGYADLLTRTMRGMGVDPMRGYMPQQDEMAKAFGVPQ